MTFFRSLLFVCPAACLLAQTPPPASRPATAVPPSAPAAAPKAAPGQPVTLSLPIPPPLPKVAPDKVVLTVGQFNITAEQFDQIADTVPDQYKAFFKGPGRKQLADDLVKIFVLVQEGQRRKLDQEPAVKTQQMFQNDQVLASATMAAINKETKVDDAELRKYYDAHKADYEEIHARHILIRMQGSPVPVRPGEKDLTDPEALAKAQDVLKRIKAGEDFSKLAGSESDDTGSAATGGDLGTFGHGRMVPSFDAAAFLLQPGQISDPVKSQFGYHIIKIDSKETKSFEDAKADIAKKLGPDQAKKALENLQKTAKVVYDPEFFQLGKQ